MVRRRFPGLNLNNVGAVSSVLNSLGNSNEDKTIYNTLKFGNRTQNRNSYNNTNNEPNNARGELGSFSVGGRNVFYNRLSLVGNNKEISRQQWEKSEPFLEHFIKCSFKLKGRPDQTTSVLQSVQAKLFAQTEQRGRSATPSSRNNSSRVARSQSRNATPMTPSSQRRTARSRSRNAAPPTPNVRPRTARPF